MHQWPRPSPNKIIVPMFLVSLTRQVSLKLTRQVLIRLLRRPRSYKRVVHLSWCPRSSIVIAAFIYWPSGSGKWPLTVSRSRWRRILLQSPELDAPGNTRSVLPRRDATMPRRVWLGLILHCCLCHLLLPRIQTFSQHKLKSFAAVPTIVLARAAARPNYKMRSD